MSRPGPAVARRTYRVGRDRCWTASGKPRPQRTGQLRVRCHAELSAGWSGRGASRTVRDMTSSTFMSCLVVVAALMLGSTPGGSTRPRSCSASGVPVAEAARVLAARFDCSVRQARRYVERAAQDGPTVGPGGDDGVHRAAAGRAGGPGAGAGSGVGEHDLRPGRAGADRVLGAGPPGDRGPRRR